jgi:hypothetical protein
MNVPIPDHLQLPLRAAVEVAGRYGVEVDRAEVLQDGHTLVVRLSESLVARVVTDREGPRQGTAWFAREMVVARHLTEHRAPVIPLHAELPTEPHEHLGYALNFWQFVTAVDAEPDPREVGRTLGRCHAVLRSFPEPLPVLAILTESVDLLGAGVVRERFSRDELALLRRHLNESVEQLGGVAHQALHGDAHLGNLMNTTSGLLWTDWEDAFAGPVEWDVASAVWNAKLLDGDDASVEGIVRGYEEAGGRIDDAVLDQCLTARAAVMSAWYPVLYPGADPVRQAKLQRRLDWLAGRR